MGICGPILIVDDDSGIRELISTLLLRAGLAASAAASTDEAIAIAERQRPAVAVVDVDLGAGGSGYELCRELRDRLGSIPIIFISGARTASFDRVAGLLVGADDYIVKPFDPDELVARIRNLAARPTRLDDGVPERELPAPFSKLTQREREVLRLLAEGVGQTVIARELVLSPRTVASHIQSVLGKLDLHSRAEAVAYAYREGLMDELSTRSLTASGPEQRS